MFSCVRDSYNVTDVNNPTRLFRKTNNIGYVEIDGVASDLSSFDVETVGSSSFYRNQFHRIGTHTANILLNDYGIVNGSHNFYLGDSNAIREITIPSCITYMGKMLQGCYGLSTIVCYATTPPNVNINSGIGTSGTQRSFFGMRNNGTLYVPSQSIEAYKETWMKPEGTSEETLAGHQWEIKPIPGT